MFGIRLSNFGRLLRLAGHMLSPAAPRIGEHQLLSNLCTKRFSATTRRFSLFGQKQQKSTGDKSNSENQTQGSEKISGQPEAVMNEEELKLLVELQRERESLIKTATDLEDKFKRALAETENVRSRMLRQIEETKVFAIQGFCKDLLEIPDILDLAVASVPPKTFENLKNGDNGENVELFKQFYDGVLMTRTNLHKIFNKNGLVQINPLDEKFDPNIHEAVFEMVDETKTPGTVGVVVKPGYLLQHRPIRAAKVGIVKAKS